MSTMLDLIVIGAGPGGYPLALHMARKGWKVAVIERENVGGTCLNWGCIPTKALLASAKGFHFLKHAGSWGLSAGTPGFDWPAIQNRKGTVVQTLRNGIRQLLQKAGVELVSGEARLKPGKRVVVSGSAPWEGEAKHVCLAVGSIPWAPQGFPTDRKLFWTSNEALAATEIPETLLIVGGGVIGLELGQVFAEFGSKVTVVEMMPQILPGLDAATARRLLPVFKKAGLEILTGTKVENLGENAGEVTATFGDQTRTFKKALLAMGRRPDLAVLADSGLNLAMEKQFLKIDDGFQTSEPGIYAIGDCVPGPMLAHKASYDAMILADRLAGGTKKASYAAVPSCVYTYPEISWVGLSEEEIKAKGLACKVGRFPFTANGKALCAGEPDGQVKIMLGDDSKLLGAVLWGPEVSNLIGEPTLAMTLGLDAHQVAHVIHAHPTLAEAVLEGVENALGCGVHS